MRLFELFERKHLPLRKGALQNMRGSYAAFIVVMRPKDFVRLTTENLKSYHRIFDDEFASLDDYAAKKHPDYNPDMYNMPFLRIDYETGKVMAHEGRHRAAMVAKAGGDKFPCVFMFELKTLYQLVYQTENRETGVKQNHVEDYDREYKADDRIKELRQTFRDDDHPVWYDDFEVNIVRSGGQMKGSPKSDSSTWTFKAWEPSDMPPVLVGQYDESVIVPTSDMKFGPVKGYNHYKK